MHMSEWKLKRSWRQIKNQIRTKWSELTEDDLYYEEGKEIELVHRLEQKTGKSREDIVDYLNHLSFISDLKLRA
jgi:uncharacterized protein YjbJ (UPF0337 family)